MLKPQKPVTRAKRSKTISIKKKQGKSATKKNQGKLKPRTANSIDYLRGQSQSRLKSSWANIIKRYKDVSDEEADVIDINSQEVIVDRGAIQKGYVHTFGKESDFRYSSSPSEEDDDTIWWSDLLSEDEIGIVDTTDLKSESIDLSKEKTKYIKESFLEDTDEISLWIDGHLSRANSDPNILIEDPETESGVEDENSSCNDTDSIEIPCDTSSDEQPIQPSCLEYGCKGNIENLVKRINYYDIESGSEGFETCSDYE
ncbi:9082_t:CDS:1 [Acaulospora morrowiae]|uniref:9082_t:CDS:1 n=1 Tax=Acaulospora morrowiae TaxID=94023 RepID=A0A9N9ESG7_9GLOM|nr:9082_t:CDS:1 [Acaulospora morrowiae]